MAEVRIKRECIDLQMLQRLALERANPKEFTSLQSTSMSRLTGMFAFANCGLMGVAASAAVKTSPCLAYHGPEDALTYKYE